MKNAANHKGGRASMKVFEEDSLGLGMGKPVRQVKKAGGIIKGRQQLLQIHNGFAKIIRVL